MTTITYVERATHLKKKELVYGQFFLTLLYGNHLISKISYHLLLPLVAKLPFCSYLYGALQKSPLTRYKIAPFIQHYQINTSEFLTPPETFRSFNDFFIRKLKPSARPIISDQKVAILPADARYLFFQNIQNTDGFLVKGKKFSLETLLQDAHLAQKYASGALVIARLCPTDYHRYHFPCDNTPSSARLINGPLYSVNPIALKRNIEILSENKRMITTLHTPQFGEVLFIEVGATHVGSIHQTYQPATTHSKGDEKGFFSFGGSSILLLFEPNRIQFDADLLEASRQGMEIQAHFGQSMGRSL